MDLSKILSIAGKPGLFRILSQSRGGVVVESLTDGKKFSIGQTQRVSTLSDISMFTWDGDMPLKTIFESIQKLEKEGSIDPDFSDSAALRTFFLTVLPEHDTERVYVSDIKKLVKWYKMLQDKNLLDAEITPEAEEVVVESEDSGAGEEE